MKHEIPPVKRPGDRLEYPAPFFNGQRDMLRWYNGLAPEAKGGGDPVGDGRNRLGEHHAFVHNGTNADCGALEFMAVTDVLNPEPLTSDPNSIAILLSNWVHEGAFPAPITGSPLRLVQAVDFIPAGEGGRVRTYGQWPALVNFDHVDDTYAGGAPGQTDFTLQGGLPGLRIVTRPETIVPGSAQWCIVELGPYDRRVRMKASGDIPARTDEAPGVGVGDLYYLKRSTGEYVLWKSGQEILNWSNAAYTDQASGWAEQDAAGVWHAVSEECADPIPPVPQTGEQYAAVSNSPMTWERTRIDATEDSLVSSPQTFDLLMYDNSVSQWKNVPIGVGGMYMNTPVVGADLGAGWDVIDYYDTTDITPTGCTLNTTTGEFSFLFQTVWDVRVQFNLSHNESNSSREINLRLWNVTDGSQQGPTIPIAIARNQPGTIFSYTFRVSVDATVVNDLFRWELGGGDSVTAVNWNSLDLDLTMIR